MRRPIRLSLASVCTGLLLSFILSSIAFAQQPTFPGSRLAKDLYFLAADEREGRGVGTHGLDEAADYIAARFKSLGLRTLPGTTDYFQPFTYSIPTGIGADSSLRFDDTTYQLNEQFRPLNFSPDGAFSGPVVFAGYGMTNEKSQYDDFAGIDVKGKVVLLLRYGPKGDDSTSQISLNAKASNAATHGAAAVLLVNPPRYHGGDELLGFGSARAASRIPFIQIRQEVANELLAKGGAKSLIELQDAIDSDGKPKSAALNGVTISGKVAIERNTNPLKNVLAYLPGGSHPDEFVVVGAHYDHLGHGGQGSLAPKSSEIHNGADDNASGTSAVMALAEKLVYAGRRDRSVLFILFSGEEEGLLGSEYFVDHSPVPLEKIKAMLNLDMVGRIRNETLYIGGSGTAGAFDAMVTAADNASPLQVKSFGKGGRGPSDHQSFAMKNIPVLFFFSGMHPDYHRPTDDADKINYTGLSEVVDFGMRIIDGMATMPPQQYISKYDGQATPLSGSGSRGTSVSLGVVPDYGSDEATGGVKISGTSPGSPAEGAGLKEGDVIVQISAKKIDNLYDLTDFLADAKPGDKVKIIFQRNKQRMESEATLVERKG